MQSIHIDLPSNLETLELHLFSDEHIGDKHVALQALKTRIDEVAKNPNAYCILNGDIMDNATKTSIGDIYEQTENPMEQLRLAEELFGSIKQKIIGITTGNHEERTYRKEGVDMSRLLARQLGVEDRYSPTSLVMYISFGKRRKPHEGHKCKQVYCVYSNHGGGGGRKEGGKVIRLADLASIIDADIYIHGHTHLPLTMKQGYYRTNFVNKSVNYVEKLFVNTASNIQYGGYGERMSFKPSSNTQPVILLSGKEKFAKAVL